MDPVEGRFVLHGHVSEGGPIVEGALPAAAVAGPIGDMLRGFARRPPQGPAYIMGRWCSACHRSGG